MADSRTFKITEKKPLYSQWHVSIDISTFLDGDTISDIAFSAIEKSAPTTDATDEILDMVKCIWTDSIIKPYIKGGLAAKSYQIQMKVTTAIGDKEVFWLWVSTV